MKDVVGNELEIGQTVVCLSTGGNSRWMLLGEVVGLTKHKVRIRHSELRQSIDYGTGKTTDHVLVTEFLRDPSGVVIPLTPKMHDMLTEAYPFGDLTDWN